jgi:hypothetical protein
MHHIHISQMSYSAVDGFGHAWEVGTWMHCSLHPATMSTDTDLGSAATISSCRPFFHVPEL